MENNITINMFVSFLRKNNAYFPYMLNLHKNIYNYLNIIKYIKGGKISDIINHSFTWGNTNEGWEYWYQLNNKWNKYVSKENHWNFFND